MTAVLASEEKAPPEHPQPVLSVKDLDVVFRVRGNDRLTIRDVSFEIGQREAYGIVGESGCGKSTTTMAIARYLPRNGRVTAGSITINGTEVTSLEKDALRELRARAVSMVYQEPGRALNPSLRVGLQIAEAFRLIGCDKKDALGQAEEALKRVQISDPGRVMRSYPHQLSGGMLQRAVIAMALASNPSLLILDEPTTALDATVEAEVLDLVTALRAEFDTSVLFISHNLAVIAKMCERVGVMYAGELVEEGPARQVFEDPHHPYTVGLLRCVPRRGHRKDQGRLDTIPGFLPAPGQVPSGCVFAPRCELARDRCRTETPPMYDVVEHWTSRCHYFEEAPNLPRTTPEAGVPSTAEHDKEPVVRLRGVSKTFHAGGHNVHAVVDVDLDLYQGETLGIVGESGCGKTTLAKILVGLTAPDAGSVIELKGKQIGAVAEKRDREQLRSMQIVFQNPDSALNRRHSVRHIISRTLSKLAGLSGRTLEARLLEIVHSFRMEERHLPMRPAQLSGGLKQRVAIARAFAGSPAVLVCDEPTSALDVSVQAAILNLLADLQQRERVTYVFISHDLGVVRYLSDRIAVLYLGRVMDYGPAESVFSAPHHPYTEALLSSLPNLDGQVRQRIKLTGDIPSSANPPSGCVFHTRCPRKLDSGVCESVEPPVLEAESGHVIRCHIPVEELRALQETGENVPAAT